MYKSCSKCGRVHNSSYICNQRTYKSSKERTLRNTYKWELKSKEIRERANYLCEICKQEQRFNYNNLEVHHIVPLKDNPGGLLDNFNLLCLCVKHHKEADAGKIDLDYQLELARLREIGQ